MTLLHCAAAASPLDPELKPHLKGNHLQVARQLLILGADCRALDHSFMEPVHVAAFAGKEGGGAGFAAGGEGETFWLLHALRRTYTPRGWLPGISVEASSAFSKPGERL